MDYKDQIKDANWQRKRLEIMKRDGFQCLACGEAFDLAVHHLHYETGKMIWEYENESLVTLCNHCHKMLHLDLVKLSGIIAFHVLVGKYDLGLIDI